MHDHSPCLPCRRRRIFQYYLPVFFWCEAQLRQHRTQPGTSGPLVLGISAPQVGAAGLWFDVHDAAPLVAIFVVPAMFNRLQYLAPLPPGLSACPPAAPQGCGKTTLCEQLQSLFEFTGSSAASISIDDFYLTYQGQQAGAWHRNLADASGASSGHASVARSAERPP